MMKRYFLILCSSYICIASVFGQNGESKYVEAPREIVLQVIAVQPGCPIKFEDVRYFVGVNGGGTGSYQLRNIGTKPIKSVTVASSGGAINTYSREKGVLVMPGQLVPDLIPDCENCAGLDIVPLTNELREKLKLKGPMQTIAVLMITNVEFTDGTKYNDEKTFDAMKKLMEKASDALEQQKQRATKSP